MTSTAQLLSLARDLGPKLARTARFLGLNGSEVDDAVQASWLAVLESNSKGVKLERPEAYVFGVLYRVANEKRKRAKVTSKTSEQNDADFDSHFDDAEHWIDVPPDLEKKYDDVKLSRFLKLCIEALEPKSRQVMAFAIGSDASRDDIAEQFKMQTNHVGVVLHRAKNALRLCLEKKIR
jgi:RNA polymerase sigma factor (sigma-70 family)